VDNTDKQKKELEIRDKQVEKMIKEWDLVKCLVCGREISMLTSLRLDNERGYICKGRHDNP